MTNYEKIITETESETIKAMSMYEMAEHFVKPHCKDCDEFECSNCLCLLHEIDWLESEVTKK